MKNDQRPPGRRTLLRLAAGLGAAAAVRMIAADPAGEAVRATAPPPAGAPGLKPAVRTEPTAHRLRPMTAGAPPRFRPTAPPVRTRPFEELPEIGHAMVLTFDDGPDPLYTPQILATLRAHDVRAMFFLCGEMAHDNQDLVRAIADDGHTIGNHSWNHPLVTRLSRAGVRDELGPTAAQLSCCTPSVAGGMVCAGTGAGRLYAYDAATGQQRWGAQAAGVVDSTPALAEGLVFVGDSHSGVYAMDGNDGGLLWHLPDRYGASSPAICGSSGWIVGTKYGRGLFKISLSTGVVLWRHALDGRGTGPVHADGVVYVGTHAGTVLAVDAETGRKPVRARRRMRV
ncbi:PQQ-binding-like beta-propeller repeat protein [Streptomyces sp. NPDC088135]|uniref:outer membrane protein assembly factor BamB family protein n=1 Tax=Streptomyces sp. NPDC088135 TaxID=3160993 RepID=UPI003430ABEA